MSNKVIPIKTSEELNIKRLKKGQIHKLSIHVHLNSMGVPWKIPVMVAKGENDGPVLGITAAVHGDELNGLPTIFKAFRKVKLDKLAGSLVAVPVVNVPGYLFKQRKYLDNTDLNRIMPGEKQGNSSQMYAYHFTHKIVKKFDYLLDLHTASAGRVNSLYIRADLDNDQCEKMAMLQEPDIIVNKYDEVGTLRAWANSVGIPAITIEIGNPNRIQHELVDCTYDGIANLMKHLKMIPGKPKTLQHDVVICNHSYWIYAPSGGVIDVFPKLTDQVERGEQIATIYNVYGEVSCNVIAPEEGIVIGKSVSPVCEAGSRVLHLGVKEKAEF